MIGAAHPTHGRPGRAILHVVAGFVRFLLLYPLTLVGGAALLWLGMGLLSAGMPLVAPTNPASRSESASAFGGVQLVAAGDGNGGDNKGKAKTYGEKREARIDRQNEADDAKRAADRRHRDDLRGTPPSDDLIAKRQDADDARKDRRDAAQAKREALRAKLTGQGGQQSGSGSDGRSELQAEGGRATLVTPGRHTSGGAPTVTGQPAPSTSTEPPALASTGRCTESKSGKSTTCRVTSGTGADRKVETCTQRNGKGCEDGLLVSTRNGAGEASARCYIKGNGQSVCRTRETTGAGTSTATSVGKRDSAKLVSSVGGGSNCRVDDGNSCHTKTRALTDPAAPGIPAPVAMAPVAMAPVAMAQCGNRGDGRCTSAVTPARFATCATHGPECQTSGMITDPRTGDMATSSARCAQHADGSCRAATVPELGSACTGTDGHTFCRTDAVAPFGATTGACRQTDGKCRSTSELIGRKGLDPRSACTSHGAASICDTRAAANGGTPAVGYAVNLLGGTANSSASVRRGADCSATGSMIHCSSTSARTADAKTSCTHSKGARCTKELDRKAGTMTADCTAITGKAKCTTRSNGQSVPPLDPPPGEPLPITMADAAAATNPAVLKAARGKSDGPLTVEQAQAQVRKLQSANARASEQLDRLAPHGNAVNAFADVLDDKHAPTQRQIKAFNAFSADHSNKVEQQVGNYDKSHAALRKVDVALAAASGDTKWAATVKAADARVTKALKALNAMPEPKTAKQGKLYEKRSTAYQKALGDYNKAISSTDRAAGTAFRGYQLPSTGAQDVFAPQVVAGRLPGYLSYQGEFADVFRGLSPDELANQAAAETVDEAVARMTREQAAADAGMAPPAPEAGSAVAGPMGPASAAPAGTAPDAPQEPVATGTDATSPLDGLLAQAKAQVDAALTEAAGDPETADQVAQAKDFLADPKGFVNNIVADAMGDAKAQVDGALAEAAGDPEVSGQLAQAKQLLAGLKPNGRKEFAATLAKALAQAKQAIKDAAAKNAAVDKT